MPSSLKALASTAALLLLAVSAPLSAMPPAPWAAAGQEPGTAATILFLGDSLTAGYGIDPELAFPARVQARIDQRGWNWRVVNAGVSGETSAGGLRRIDWLLRRPVDLLVLELGGNDGLRGIPPADTRANLQSIIDRTRARYPDVELVIAGMQIPPNLGSEYTAAFRQLYPDLAATNGAALIPFLLEGVGGVPDLNLPDGIHPTPAGHVIVADNVWAVLEEMLRPR